jgi:hypothetical protein
MVFESGRPKPNEGPLAGLGTASRLGPLHNAGTILYETFIIKDGYLASGIICFNVNAFNSA